MFLVTGITDYPAQNMNLTLPDSTVVQMQIKFVPMQLGWFITSLIYNTFTLSGIRIVNSPNILLQYQNQIPFGLACYSTANRDPSLQQDFSSGASQLYILDSTEVKEVYSFLQTGTV